MSGSVLHSAGAQLGVVVEAEMAVLEVEQGCFSVVLSG